VGVKEELGVSFGKKTDSRLFRCVSYTTEIHPLIHLGDNCQSRNFKVIFTRIPEKSFSTDNFATT